MTDEQETNNAFARSRSNAGLGEFFMEMTRNENGTTVWVQGDLTLLLQDDMLFVIFGMELNARIGDGRVDFMVGSPSALRRALLSLTREYDTIPLAGITTDAVTR